MKINLSFPPTSIIFITKGGGLYILPYREAEILVPEIQKYCSARARQYFWPLAWPISRKYWCQKYWGALAPQTP